MAHDERLALMHDQIWNAPAETATMDQASLAAVVEQYKLFVEMADRASARRGNTNTYFLTLNTAVFTLITAFWANQGPQMVFAQGWLALPLGVLLVECAAWFALLRSYRQLGSAKWRVVGAMETRLPASPWWQGERADLQRQTRFLRLANVERLVPLLFAVAYVGAFLMFVTQ